MSPQNSASHVRLPRTQACFPRPIVLFCLGDGISLTASAYRGIRSTEVVVRTATSHTTLFIPVIRFVAKCEAQIVLILFVVFSSNVITSPYPLKMSPQNSASHFRLPRTQACFPRPSVLFCLGGGISLTASAYQGIRSNANSTDRHTRPCRTTVSYL